MPEARNTQNHKPKMFVKKDMQAIIDYTKKHYPQLFLLEAFEHNCGLRPGSEIRLMKVGWIDFHRGIISVPEEFNLKSKRDKHVTIPPAFLDVLTERYHIHHYDDDCYVLGKDTGGTPGDMHWGKNHFSNLFRKVCEKLGLPDKYKMYGMKHSGASQAIDDGVSLRSVSAQLGHTNIETTSRYVDSDIEQGLHREVYS